MYQENTKTNDMTLSASQIELIKSSIKEFQNGTTCRSIYIEIEDVVLRIADHFPNLENFSKNEQTRAFCILINIEDDGSFTDKCSDFCESFSNNMEEIDYVTVDSEEDIEIVINLTNRF